MPDLPRPLLTSRPLLTLAIPTYNRVADLGRLLHTIAPELAQLPQVELLISDNASPDATEALVRGLQGDVQSGGLRCTYLRNAKNLDADPNFLQCYERATGQYVWIFSDDDLLLPGSLTRIVHMLEEHPVDLVYVAPFGFVTEPNERGQANPAPRMLLTADPHDFVRSVGLRGDLVLISAVIVNKDTVEAGPHADFASGFQTQLLQMGWTFTALGRMRRGLVVERGLYAVCESDAPRLFNIGKVFGANWAIAAQTYLGHDPQLYRTVLNDQLYSWFVTNWYGMRRRAEHTDLSAPMQSMRPFYGRLPLFWICVVPLLRWPMPLAGAWLALWRGMRRVHRAVDGRRFHSPPIA